MTKPYRPNVGIALFNANGHVLIARRFQDDGPEIIYPGLEWQMPQGGIDPNEDPRPAAQRELYEETGVTSVAYLGETPDWMTYDFPPYDGPPHRLERFPRAAAEVVRVPLRRRRARDHGRGRAQRSAGRVRCVALGAARQGGALVVPFRREVYQAVAREFARFAA